MIIRLESATSENVDTARRNLEALAHSWDHEMIEAQPKAAGAAGNDDKLIDPVSLVSRKRGSLTGPALCE